MRKVYSSHCLEHLDDDTVAQVLSEARRVIAPDGKLVVKLPDFDLVLEKWNAGNRDYFFGEPDSWAFRKVVPTWKNRGIADSVDARASYIFCGFWNRSYGDHFSDQRRPDRIGAYNGPLPRISELAGTLMELASPHEIARVLRETILRDDKDVTFNHQNAWGKQEFADLLARFGFAIVSTNTDDIVAENADIPDIEAMKSISRYYSARPIPYPTS
jgi:SAM-dependent methyltransferase